MQLTFDVYDIICTVGAIVLWIIITLILIKDTYSNSRFLKKCDSILEEIRQELVSRSERGGDFIE